MNKFLRLIFILSLVVVTSSCDIDEVITTALPPKIVLDSQTGIYTVKQGRQITIAPEYESVEGATYRWLMNGEVLSTSPSLAFTGKEVGGYFITISVATEAGVAEEEIRVDVVDLEIPTISIAGDNALTVVVGTELSFSARSEEHTSELQSR